MNDAEEQTESKEQADDVSVGKEQQTTITDDKSKTQSTEAFGTIEEDADQAAFNDAIKAANTSGTDQKSTERDTLAEQSSDAESAPSSRKHTGRQQSMSIQSKIRSTSFRQSGPLSPSALPDSDDSLYRKQVQRIEELEKDNTRLLREANEGESRWRKSEEELEELREKAAEAGSNSEIEKLREEINSLRRSSRASVSAGVGRARQASVSNSNEDADALKKELEAKESTIADLQLELSRMRSQVSAQTEGRETHSEQVAALQSNLDRAENGVKRLEAELADSKKAVTRASEKTLADGTEKTSRETKIKALERENEKYKVENEELIKKVDVLEKKVEAMAKLHREAEQRYNTKLSSAEAQAKEVHVTRSKMEGLEREITRLREARKRTMSGDGDDDGLDELEDEERKRLEQRVRELEGEVFDLRRGVWRDKRKELQPGMTEEDGDEFDDVDLSGSGFRSRTRSTTSQGPFIQHSGFTQVLSSGLAAFTSSGNTDGQNTRPRNDSLLQDFDDDAFDEQEFARLQREEELKKMVEHVREVKRGLKKWTGWRLDLVDARRGGGGWGVGEVFDI